MTTKWIKWIKTAHKGLRYYEHATEKHGKKKDRYYSIRLKVDGKDYTYGIGWWSEGIPEEIKKNDPDMGFEEYALSQIKLYKANIKAGSGVKSPKEKRNAAAKEEAQKHAEEERLERESVTFERFFIDTYLPQSKVDKKPRTAQREEGFYENWFKTILGNEPLKSITTFHLERLKKEMSDKKQSARSIEYALAVIRQVFNTAKRLGLYDSESPTLNVRKPKVDNGRMRFLTQGEAAKLLDVLKEKSTDVHDMALLSLHAGLRFGEIASLTWQDIDLTKGVLTIRDAKAGSRYAFLTPQAADMLKNRKQDKPSEYVFQQRRGKKQEGEERKKGGKMTKISHTFFRAVDKLKMNEGIDDPRLKICFHSCRHSYASWMIEQGADLYTVQKLLGHKTNVMTQRYAHLAENKLREATTALGAALAIGNNQQDQTEEAEQQQAGQLVNLAK